MPINEWGSVRSAPAGHAAGTDQPATLDSSGAMVVLDFLTKSILWGKGYQVRLGVLTTPVTGDVEVTTVAAEMSADSLALGDGVQKDNDRSGDIPITVLPATDGAPVSDA